jgi:hypothetical protein
LNAANAANTTATATANANGITTLQSSLTTTNTNLSGLQTVVSGFSADITAAQTTANTALTATETKAGNIATLQTQTDSNTTAINSLQSGLAMTNEQVAAIKADSETVSLTKASNVTGNVHGIVIGNTSTTISGGTTSTQMTLNDDTVDFKHFATGAPVRLTGVADVTQRYDAVNKGQLDTAMNALRSELGKMEADLHRVDMDAQRGIASLAAINNAPTPSSAGKWTMAIGAANYKTQSATGISFAYRGGVDAGSPVFSAGVGYS